VEGGGCLCGLWGLLSVGAAGGVHTASPLRAHAAFMGSGGGVAGKKGMPRVFVRWCERRLESREGGEASSSWMERGESLGGWGLFGSLAALGLVFSFGRRSLSGV